MAILFNSVLAATGTLFEDKVGGNAGYEFVVVDNGGGSSITVQTSPDDATWTTLTGGVFNITSGAPVLTNGVNTAKGKYWIDPQGAAYVRIRVSTYVSGVVEIRCEPGSTQPTLSASSGPYSITGQGNVDLSAQLQALIDEAAEAAAYSRQAVEVRFTGVVTAAITLRSGVSLKGHGRAVLRLPNGSNKNVVEGASFQSLTGTNSGAGIARWEISDCEIDGNSANQGSPAANNGHGIATYGRDFIIRNVYVRNTKRVGIWLEYGNGAVGTSPFNGRMTNVVTDSTGEHGLYLKVSDIHVDDVNVRSPGQNADNTYDGIYLDAAGHISKVNVWRAGGAVNTHRYAVNITANADTTTLHASTFETSKTSPVYVGGSHCVLQYRSYNLLGTAHCIIDGNGNDVRVNGFKGGVSGETAAPYGVQFGSVNAVQYNSAYANIQGADGGLFNFTNTGGSNHFQGTGFGGAGGAVISGTPNNRDWGTATLEASASADRQQITKEPNDQANGFTLFGTGVQGDATVITKGFVKVLKSGSGSGRLRKDGANGPVGGEFGLIYNSDGTATSIYPHTGGQFKGLGTNAAVSIPAGGYMAYWNGPSPIPYFLI